MNFADRLLKAIREKNTRLKEEAFVQQINDFFSDQESFGTVLMGRKTYDVGLKKGITSPYPAMRQVVFSRTLESSPDPEVELVQGGIPEFVKGLKASADKPIWLCGGAEIASALMNAGLIDRLVVKLNPVVFGSGVQLVPALGDLVSLELERTKQYNCGIIILTYRVR